MMKNLLLILADMAMNKTGSYRWVAVSIMSKLRFLTMILVMSVLSLIVIGSALNMIMMDLQRTTEIQHQLSVTSVSAIGLGIIFCSLTAIYLFFRKSVWGLNSAETPVEEPIPNLKAEQSMELSPLMQALSMLVLDFVDERREKRQRTQTARSESVTFDNLNA